MSERYAIQESSLRRDLQATSTRAEIAETELSTKDDEIKELRDSKLLFKKKVGPYSRLCNSVSNGGAVSCPQTETIATLGDFKRHQRGRFTCNITPITRLLYPTYRLYHHLMPAL